LGFGAVGAGGGDFLGGGRHGISRFECKSAGAR
jgi:hypothetical protein